MIENNSKSKSNRGTPRAKYCLLVNWRNDFTKPRNLTSHITKIMQPVRLNEVNTGNLANKIKITDQVIQDTMDN